MASPDEEGINRLDQWVNKLDLEYRAIHRMELLADNTVAMFAKGRGDVEELRRILPESPEVVEFSISGDDAGFEILLDPIVVTSAGNGDDRRQRTVVVFTSVLEAVQGVGGGDCCRFIVLTRNQGGRVTGSGVIGTVLSI